MKKRIFSVMLSLTLLFGMIGIAHFTTIAEPLDYSTVAYTDVNVVNASLSSGTNLLVSAVGMRYNSGGVTEGKKSMASLVDGKMEYSNKLADGDGESEYVYLIYDMGSAYDITSLLYAGDTNDGASNLAVYVGNKNFEDVLADAAAFDTIRYDGFIGKSVRVPADKNNGVVAVRFNLTEAVTGRYIIFRLGSYSEWPMVWASECVAVGTLNESEESIVAYTDVNVVNTSLSSGTNLLASAASMRYNSGGVKEGKKSMAALVDGKMEYSNKLADGDGESEYVYLIYDMGSAYDITALLYAGDTNDGASNLAVYVGNKNFKDVLADAAAFDTIRYDGFIGKSVRVPTDKNNGVVALRFNLTEAVTGRYIIFRLGSYSEWPMVWASECVAVGTKAAGGDAVEPIVAYTDVDSLNAGLAATVNMLADATNMQYLSGGEKIGIKATDMLVDGKVGSAESEKLADGDGKSDYVYFVYDMGCSYDIRSLLYAGDTIDGAANLAVYVGNKDLNDILEDATAFDTIRYDGFIGKSPRVPADKNDGVIAVRFNLTEVVSGRYIIFRLGSYSEWPMIWASEFSAEGVKGIGYKTTVYNQTETVDNIPAVSENVLVEAKNAGWRFADRTEDAKSDKLTGVLMDGKISDAVAETMAFDAGNTVDYTDGYTYVYLTYDMEKVYNIDRIVYAGDGVHGADALAVYIGNDELTAIQSGNADPVAVYEAQIGATEDAAAVSIVFDVPKEGRYITFRMRTRDNAGKQTAWASEVAAEGIDKSLLPVNLLAGATPYEKFTLPARGIDNKTAVDVYGNPGSGNTGKLNQAAPLTANEPIKYLTDGDLATRSAQNVEPSSWTDDRYKLNYDTGWMALIYRLDGYSRIDEIAVSSSSEDAYYVSGVQYYASNMYADLFKNESLLYTTKGENYVLDEENSFPDDPSYLPDASTDCNQKQTISYTLTEEQKETKYLYVAIVVTRPTGMWDKNNPTERLMGYNLARISEIEVNGAVVAPIPPLYNTYTCETSVGEVTVQVSPLTLEERAFFNNTLGGVVVTETKLPKEVIPNIENNLLSVDLDTVFTFQLVDKQGNPIPEVSEDMDKGMNGREVEYSFPSTGKYVQTMAVLENGALRRLYNSYTNIQKGNRINAGNLNYPHYDEVNNRSKAVLNTAKISLVYMKLNSLKRIDELGGVAAPYLTLDEFMGNDDVAGVQTASLPKYVWLWCAIPTVFLTTVTAVFLRRKARRNCQ